MSRNFGKNASGQLIRDETTNQAFQTMEKDLKSLSDTSAKSTKFKADVIREFEIAMSGITSSSSASDIGTALKNLTEKIKGL